jgi:TonB family protein
MRKLVLLVLSCAVCACVVSAPPGPSFKKDWRFLDGVAAGPGDMVEPPVVKVKKAATYPIEARKQRLQGEVGLELTVDDEGRVVKAEVVQPLEPTMDEAALAAAQTWTFDPPRLNGVPKASVVREAVTFAVQ